MLANPIGCLSSIMAVSELQFATGSEGTVFIFDQSRRWILLIILCIHQFLGGSIKEYIFVIWMLQGVGMFNSPRACVCFA